MQITNDLYIDLRHLDAIYPVAGSNGALFTVLMESGERFEISAEHKDAVFAKENELMEQCRKEHNHQSEVPPILGMLFGQTKKEEPKPDWPENL